MLKKIRSVIYTAPHLAAAKEWYRKATGQDPYFDEPFYVGFDIQGFELGLDPNATGGPGNQTIAYWAVDDCEAAGNHLAGIGGKIVQPKTNVGGPTFVVIVEDPFGNQLGLIEGA